MTRRLVLHADMDAFYASIEQRDDPSLRGRPVIVGASSARGVVAAASYEARKYGVRSAMPGFRAKQLCPDGVFLPSRMEKYVHVSEQVHGVLGRFSPDLEPIALDEAFLDITGSAHLFGGPLALGFRLKREVRAEVDLPISVGIGPNKLVAKLACTLSKPDGFLYVPEEATRWLLDPLPVRRLWGVGPVFEKTLTDLGYQTIGELARADPAELSRVIGDRAHQVVRMARGEDDRDVVAHGAPKSYGEENTFARDVSDRETVTAALTSHAEAVARRLRHDRYAGRTITLKIKLGKARGQRASRTSQDAEPDYPVLTRSKTLPRATSDGKRIRDVAVALWDAAKVGEPVRLLGVSVSNLEGGEAEQLDLFSGRQSETALGKALDEITAKFGKGKIRRAVDDPEKATATDRKKRGE